MDTLCAVKNTRLRSERSGFDSWQGQGRGVLYSSHNPYQVPKAMLENIWQGHLGEWRD